MFRHHLVQALIILSPLGSLHQPLKWSSSLSSVLSSNSGKVILANVASMAFSRIEEKSCWKLWEVPPCIKPKPYRTYSNLTSATPASLCSLSPKCSSPRYQVLTLKSPQQGFPWLQYLKCQLCPTPDISDPPSYTVFSSWQVIIWHSPYFT